MDFEKLTDFLIPILLVVVYLLNNLRASREKKEKLRKAVSPAPVEQPKMPIIKELEEIELRKSVPVEPAEKPKTPLRRRRRREFFLAHTLLSRYEYDE